MFRLAKGNRLRTGRPTARRGLDHHRRRGIVASEKGPIRHHQHGAVRAQGCQQVVEHELSPLLEGGIAADGTGHAQQRVDLDGVFILDCAWVLDRSREGGRVGGGRSEGLVEGGDGAGHATPITKRCDAQTEVHDRFVQALDEQAVVVLGRAAFEDAGDGIVGLEVEGREDLSCETADRVVDRPARQL